MVRQRDIAEFERRYQQGGMKRKGTNSECLNAGTMHQANWQTDCRCEGREKVTLGGQRQYTGEQEMKSNKLESQSP